MIYMEISSYIYLIIRLAFIQKLDTILANSKVYLQMVLKRY